MNFLNQKKKKENPAVDSSIASNPKSEINQDQKEKKIPDDKTEKLQRQLNNLFLVNELSQRITSSLSIEESFEHLYRTINSMMDASVLELLVYSDDEKRLFFSNKQYPDSSSELTHYNHMSEWSLKNNKEIFLEDAENDYGRYVFKALTLPDGKASRSLMSFPIQYLDKITGTLCIISFNKNAFELFHKEMIRLLLPFVGVAINNASTHQQIIDLKHRAERSEQFMQQFLANMSHEIRTPMNAVMGMTNILLQKNPQQEQLKYLNTIQKSSENLLVILNDILDLSKIEAGKIELEQIDFSVADVVNTVKEIMQVKAEEKGLLLKTEVDEKIPPILVGDPARLTQVLINLVGNAVKFTEKGSVSLIVNRETSNVNEADASHVSRLTFHVIDTGIGMTEEQQQKLFQDYVQASADTARKYGGTGLGLSISKQLVQLQGGRIEVLSKPGEGSVFSFTLSYALSKNKNAARKENTLSEEMLHQLNGIKILIADDNEYNRIVAKETLQLKIKNAMVGEALDGRMAIEMIEKNSYDAVLMDLVMPGMSGYEATQFIRHQLSSPKNQIKILALTASVARSEIEKCMAVGMNGFIPKPFITNQMLATIYNALHREKNILPEQIVVDKNLHKSNGKLTDLRYLDEFTEGDVERRERYIDLFLSKIPSSISEIKSALEEKDFERLRIAVHSMKPLLSSVGVNEAVELGEQIENAILQNQSANIIEVMIPKLNELATNACNELASR